MEKSGKDSFTIHSKKGTILEIKATGEIILRNKQIACDEELGLIIKGIGECLKVVQDNNASVDELINQYRILNNF